MELPRSVSISTNTFIKAVLIVLGVWFFWFIRDILAIFLVSILFAALIDPFADWFQKIRVPRALAVIIVYVLIGTLAALVSILLIPVLIEQMISLVSTLSAPDSPLVEFFGRFKTFTVEHGFQENVRQSLQSFSQEITQSIASITSTVRGFFGGIAALFLVLVLTFYMVVEEDTARKYFKNLAPVEYQPYLVATVEKMQRKIGAWLRGQLILGLVVGVFVYIGLTIIGVDYALLLAIIAGIFEIVPYVGPIISLIPALVIGFGQAPVTGLFVLGLYLLIQQFENNVLVPKIMQKVTGLNPIVSIAALLIGIKLGGLVGAIIAIPVATMLVVVLEDLFHEPA